MTALAAVLVLRKNRKELLLVMVALLAVLASRNSSDLLLVMKALPAVLVLRKNTSSLLTRVALPAVLLLRKFRLPKVVLIVGAFDELAMIPAPVRVRLVKVMPSPTWIV